MTLDCLGGSSVTTRVCIKKEAGGDVVIEEEVREREIWRCYTAGFEDGDRGHEPRKAGSL